MVRFWIVTAILCAAGFALFYKYYLPQFRPAVKALVYGLARSGVSAAERLRERGDEVIVVDRTLGNEDDLSLLDGVERRRQDPRRAGRARRSSSRRASAGIPVWSEVELGYRLLPGRRGSSASPARTARRRRPSCSARSSAPPAATSSSRATSARRSRRSRDADWVVCELSSFQLEDVHELACDVAVLLNLEPDHLDRHGTFEAYRDAKLRIFERARAKVVPRGLGLAGDRVLGRRPAAGRAAAPRRHNRENAAAATAAARAAGSPTRRSPQALRTFPGVPHRLELVGERRRRPLRERLEGDERRRGAAGARGLRRRAGAPDPRRLARRARTSRRSRRRSGRTSARST